MFRPELLRQALIFCGISMGSISDGFIFGQMSGMVAALAGAGPGDELRLTPDQLSWIAATINATCVCGFAIASFVSDKIGRRRAMTVLTAPIVGVWLLVYLARDYAAFILSRILVGACFGGVTLVLIVSTAEYTSPNVRGVWLNIVNSSGVAVGTMIGHTLGFFFHWRTVALLGIVPTGLAALLPCFWVESPAWLAKKAKYKECEASFKALHGHRTDADKELQLLLQMERMKHKKTGAGAFVEPKKLLAALKKKYFWNLCLLCGIINVYRVAGSKVLFSTLAVTMLQEMTGRSDILSFTLLVDGFLVLGAFLSCFFISRMKMRTLLFSSGLLANVFLLALSASLYLGPAGGDYFPWINCSLLALYFIAVNAGPYPVLETLFGEIFPMDIKGSCMFLFGTFGGSLHFVAIKYSPSLFGAMGYHGVFLLNGIVMALCMVYFWVRLPETKGRSLEEIELYFKNNTFDKADHLRNGEQIKVLI